jgi:hypothetical protein
VSGSPPSYLIRTWPTDLSPWTIVGSTTSTPPDFDSAQNFVDVNDSGLAVFQGLIDGSVNTALFAGVIRPPIQVAVFTGVVSLRPQISNTDLIVIRDPQNRIVLYPAFGGNPEILATTSNFATLGQSPGISPDGRLIGFYGDLTAAGAQALTASNSTVVYSSGAAPHAPTLFPGPGVFVCARTNGGHVIVRVAGLNNNTYFDPGEVKGTSGQDLGPFSAFSADSRIGVTSVRCPDRCANIAFLANSSRGSSPQGMYVSRLGFLEGNELSFNADEPQNFGVGAFGQLTEVGRQPTGLSSAITGLGVYDPISYDGTSGFWASTSSGQGVLRGRFVNLMRQLRQDDGTWKDTRIVSGQPGDATDTIGKYGCTLTSLSMAVGITGADLTPPQLAAFLAGFGRINRATAQTDVNSFFYAVPTGSTGCGQVVVTLPRPLVPEGLTTIEAELRAGRPVLLKVPTSTKTRQQIAPANGGGKGHYILAYSLTPDAPPNGATPSQMLVADPSRWQGNRYTGLQTWDETGVFTSLTLQDYFDRLNSFLAGLSSSDPRHTLHYDPTQWYNAGHFTDSSLSPSDVTLNIKDRRILITKFGSPTDIPNPWCTVTADTPLELVLIDPATGARYASDASVAQPGDVILDKYSADLAATNDESLPDPDPDPAGPPFVISVPQVLVNRTVTVEMHGLATGSYSVRYGTGTLDFSVGAPLQGTIATGQVITGQFNVNSTSCYANCDNSSNPPILNTNDFQCFLNKFAAGDPYANCDGSSVPPILNVNDFQCFLNKFAVGCP